MVFHELAHQVLYVSDDTVFNESFATAVERLGAERWLALQATPQARQAYSQYDQRRRQFRALTRATRGHLNEIYKKNSALAHENKELTAIKNIALKEFLAAYVELKTQWGGYSGYDAWVAQANNAAFGAQAAYDELVPGFEALFEREGRDWVRFYDAVRQLAKRPAQERTGLLKQWALEQHLG
jgi:predicted aminopeptidase